jgi:16S rRNA (cytidine1402-2'-O)-methyltransferase
MKVFLIPTPIGEHDKPLQSTIDILNQLDYFFVENSRTARRFIASLKLEKKINELTFEILDKDTKDVQLLFQKVPKGKNIGIMSEAGCPGIADPGALAVAHAHKQGFEVVPLVGASSIVLALMASGLNGQSFAFHGYLPIKTEDRKIKILKLAKDSSTLKQSQIFIETPYRNDSLFADLKSTLPKDILLTIASGLQTETQFVKTKLVSNWQKEELILGKVPVVYLISYP